MFIGIANISSFFFFVLFFRNILQTDEKILIKKNGVLAYKKARLSEHRKNYVLRDIDYFVKMSVSTSGYKFVSWLGSKSEKNANRFL